MRDELKAYFSKHQGSILRIVLGASMVFFIAFLIVVYFVAKSENPIFLDEKGQPLQSQTQSRGN
jgi:hypothetical protein